MKPGEVPQPGCDDALGEPFPSFRSIDAFAEPEVRPGLGASVAGWEEAAQVLLEDLAGSLLRSWHEAGRLETLEREILLLQERVSRLETMAAVCVPIETLAPEPYEVLKPFHAVIQAVEDEYVASFFDANLNASGATQDEALANLKDVIVMVFESLTAHEPDQLGRGPARQLEVLKEFVRRRE